MARKTPDLSGDDSPILKVALCQIATEPWAVADNLGRALTALDEAASQGAELAILPECLLHGYADNDSADYPEKMLAIAEPLGGPNLAALRRKARERGLEVVAGFCERGAGGNIHNTAALIGRDGELVYAYRKVHCRPFESIEHQGRFVPGDRFYATERTWGAGASERRFRIGTMICFDREVSESVRCLRALGAQLIACPLATDTERMDRLFEQADNELITRARAAENEVFIVVVNHARRYNGGSFAVGPGGQVLAQLGAAPEVRTLDLPLGIVARRFHNDPLGWMGFGFRRPDVYRPYLG